MTTESPFTTGGPVHSDKTKIYIRRGADEQLLNNCIIGEYSVVLTARQMGKTSLLQHTMEELKQQGVAPIFIDLNSIGTGGVSAVDWYKSILQIISESLDFSFDIEAWWGKTNGSMSVKFAKFLTDVVVQKVDKNIVIFVDEIELTTQLEFSDSFFSVIRSLYSARGTNKILNRLSFVLVGMARISDLIRQPDITTFNVGKRIELENFSSEEIMPLVKRIPNSKNILSELTSWIMEWTGGQPYLTQLVCETLSSSDNSPGVDSGKERLDKTVRSLLSQSEIKDKHFNTIQRYLIEKPSIVFGVYALLLAGEEVFDVDTISDLQYLKLAGVVKVQEKKLVIANRIYKEALGSEWLGIQLKRRKLTLDLDVIIKTSRESLLTVNQLSSRDDGENITPRSVENVNIIIENNDEEVEVVEDDNLKEQAPKTLASLLRAFNHFRHRVQNFLIPLLLIIVGALIIWYLALNSLLTPISAIATHLVSIPSFIVVFLTGMAIIVISLVVGGYISSNNKRKMIEKLLAFYDEDSSDLLGEQRSILSDWVSQPVERVTYGDRIARDLARADLKINVGEYFVLILISILFSGLIAWFLGNRHPISSLIGCIVGAFAPGMYVKSQQIKRLQKFNDQLSDMLNLMVTSLRAGYSTMQAMEVVSKELPAPISDEFRRVIVEIQIGIAMETALDSLLRRIPSEDLDRVVTAIIIQRETGGNLSEILDLLHYRFRERQQTLLRAKGLGGPSLLFFVGSSGVALIIHSVIFPNSFAAIENINGVQILQFSLLGIWSFVLALVVVLQLRRNALLNELYIHRNKKNWFVVGITLTLVFGGAYLTGVPAPLIGWLLFFAIFVLF